MTNQGVSYMRTIPCEWALPCRDKWHGDGGCSVTGRLLLLWAWPIARGLGGTDIGIQLDPSMRAWPAQTQMGCKMTNHLHHAASLWAMPDDCCMRRSLHKGPAGAHNNGRGPHTKAGSRCIHQCGQIDTARLHLCISHAVYRRCPLSFTLCKVCIAFSLAASHDRSILLTHHCGPRPQREVST
jgi:hypothetical protein